MSTYRELVYMILDELKIISDDSQFTEEHIIFLLNKYRAFLLKQKYSDIKKEISESNYQTICLDLVEVPSISGEPCEGGNYLRSTSKIPYLIHIGNPSVYPIDFYQGIHIAYINRERMKYVGENKYLKNIIYCSIGPDNYLYFKSCNPQFLYLSKIRFTGVFQDAEKAAELQCSSSSEDTICDVLDMNFPIEEALVPPMIELIVKELLGAEYRPKDEENNAKDDLSDIASFIRNNMKSNIQKQIDG